VVVEEAQHLERALLAAHGLRVGRRQPTDQKPEAQAAHRRDHVGLLVDQPVHDLGKLERVVREERRSLGEVEEDRVRLGQEAAVVGLEDRRGPGRVHRRVLVGQRVAGEDVDRHALVLAPEQREQKPHLEAVAGGVVVVEAHHTGNAGGRGNVRRGRSPASDYPSAAATDLPSVTVETFWSA